jgi:hypothetical protein
MTKQCTFSKQGGLELAGDVHAVGGGLDEVPFSTHCKLRQSFIPFPLSFTDYGLEGLIFPDTSLTVDDVEDPGEIVWSHKFVFLEVLKIWLKIPAKNTEHLLGTAMQRRICRAVTPTHRSSHPGQLGGSEYHALSLPVLHPRSAKRLRSAKHLKRAKAIASPATTMTESSSQLHTLPNPEAVLLQELLW